MAGTELVRRNPCRTINEPGCQGFCQSVERLPIRCAVSGAVFRHLQMANWRPTLIHRTRIERIISARRLSVLASALSEGAPMKHPAQYASPRVQSVTGSYRYSPVCERWILL